MFRGPFSITLSQKVLFRFELKISNGVLRSNLNVPRIEVFVRSGLEKEFFQNFFWILNKRRIGRCFLIFFNVSEPFFAEKATFFRITRKVAGFSRIWTKEVGCDIGNDFFSFGRVLSANGFPEKI